VSPSGGWHGAFDNDNNNGGGDNDGGSDNGDDNSVRPASPLTDNSLYCESVHGLGDEAGSIQLSDEADDVDWAAHSNNDYTDNASDSDDGPEDQRARQAGSNEPTANDEDDEVEQEQHTGAAASRLKMAWNKRCTCGT
jgi:hypothetical protein